MERRPCIAAMVSILLSLCAPTIIERPQRAKVKQQQNGSWFTNEAVRQ
jgi:hypothetical protein